MDMIDDARQVQESVMLDGCRIERPTVVTDRETGIDQETWDVVWEGRCRVPRRDAGTRVIVTGQTITPAAPVVVIPWNVDTVRPDDRVTVTESISPGMVGRVLWVTDTSPRTFQSAVHLTCREVR